jgi:hypothetical protein
MHAEIRHLIALRDNEPLAADVAEHVRSCAQCRCRVDDLRRMRAALQDIRRVDVPSYVWGCIVVDADRHVSSRSRRILALVTSLSLVATLLASVIGVGWRAGVEPAAAPTLTHLQQRSRELETVLQRYGRPAVMSLRTAGTVADLEDSIALIDYQLNVRAAPGAERELWEQRVALMEVLVTVRAAEHYVDSI